MPEKYSYIAAFDLDKTILTLNSSKLVVQASRRSGLMSKREFLKAIYYSIVYKLDLKDADQIVVEMTGWLHGLKEKDVINLINEHVLPVMFNLIRPEILTEIEAHRQKNAKLVLLSSAIPYLCDPMAKYLNMNDVVCSELQIKEGKFTGKSQGKLVFGREKKVRMIKYCQENQFPLETAWYYGDAFTDRFVLQCVGNPVCVKPEFKLSRMAKRKGWRII